MRFIKGWLEFLKRQKRPAENSVGFRGTVLCLVMVGLIATTHQLEWPSYALVAIVLTALGFFFSHRRRHLNNWWVKAILSVLMLITLLNFMVSLAKSLNDPRIPLAELLIWLQCLHSWDVPARKDLGYSMLVALILMSLAGVLTFQSTFFLYLLTFFLLALASLRLHFLSQLTEELGVVPKGVTRLPAILSVVLRALLPLAILAVVIFALMPRYESMRLRALPVSWELHLGTPQTAEGGEVVNPAYPNGLSADGRRVEFSADGYYGFNSVVDLNMRGRLDNSIVMKVKSSHWTYYRGIAFDLYDGVSWRNSIEETEELTTEKPPLYVPDPNYGDREKVQIFYVERQLPNVIFAGLVPSALYFPSNKVFALPTLAPDSGEQDLTGGLRAPYALEQGMVYSVISRDRSSGPRVLRTLPATQKRLHLYEAFLQVPEVSDRTRELVRELTEGVESPWERATRLSMYLQQNYTYELDIPRYPEGAEVADYFLFESRQGYCEQFATTLVVMCRLAGVHARYVTGYLPGTYNPFTGFYEVRGTDAHAWVECYIPNYGWLAFDPVPGQDANPEMAPPKEERWVVLSLLRYLGWERPELDLPWNQILAILGFLGVSISVWLLHGWREGSKSELAPVQQVFRQAEKLMAATGRTRPASQSPRNFAASHPELPPLSLICELLEEELYGARTQEQDRAQRALDELRLLLAGKASKSSEL